MTEPKLTCGHCGFKGTPQEMEIHGDARAGKRCKPREMTLAAIRKRFESGAWDHADCVWLYTKAEQHAEMLAALEAVLDIAEAAIRKAKGEI